MRRRRREFEAQMEVGAKSEVASRVTQDSSLILDDYATTKQTLISSAAIDNNNNHSSIHIIKHNTSFSEMRTTSHLIKQKKKNAKKKKIKMPKMSSLLYFVLLFSSCLVVSCSGTGSGLGSGLRFEPESGSYSGLTFTFDPRLERRAVEWLHFEHWLSVMQQSSNLLYESLNGRAHLAEVRVLIPYKWRHFSDLPSNILKPGSPIIANRRLKFTDSDVIVGFEDPIYKETPYAIQHDECAKQGLNIHMPISFLDQNSQPLDPKLKARLLIREFASHRYGIFKESGFRWDPMYPPFTALPGYPLNGTFSQQKLRNSRQQPTGSVSQQLMVDNAAAALVTSNQSQQHQVQQLELMAASVRGFDELWQECQFEASTQSGLPLPQAQNCAPYLTRPPQASEAPVSFNLMSSDPFSHSEVGTRMAAAKLSQQQPLPVEWRQLQDSAKWHFCGDNFPPQTAATSAGSQSSSEQQTGSNQPPTGSAKFPSSFAHNQLAMNKQNVMCQERSAMDIIKSSDDFKRQLSGPNFNRLPATNFKFLQEMPPRLVLCVEYSGHLYQSRRLEHGILEAAIGKFLAYDLIADSEMALVLFGQHHSTRTPFKKLDSSVDSRLTLYSPALDPYEEAARFYTEHELLQLELSPQTASQAKLIKGTCSLGKALAEAGAALLQRGAHYDDVGADLILVTSGLFLEDDYRIEELLRQFAAQHSQRGSAGSDGPIGQSSGSGGSASASEHPVQLNLIIYPAGMLFDTRSRDSLAPGSVTLDPLEAEAVVRDRVNKLLLVQRLTGAKIHFVREHLDPNGNVKMSTLLQFYQIFEHLAKGHSWDQTHSWSLLNQQTNIEPLGRQLTGSSNATTRLSFQFQLDGSVQNELIVGFLDPKQHQLARSGKRFALKNLQLRSPGGHLILTDSHPWTSSGSQHQSLVPEEQQQSTSQTGSQLEAGLVTELQQPAATSGTGSSGHEDQVTLPATESALFPYRTQLSLAGFHLKPAHLGPLNNSHKLAGTWTLSATSDEPIQTDALAMARVNPSGDTLTAHCWIQTYYSQQQQVQTGAELQQQQPQVNQHHRQQHLKQVKVFVQTRAGARMSPPQEVDARVEIQDETGNIVQNVNMLDDGLGTPDMTRGDGIQSQYVTRAQRPGFYRVSVELTGSGRLPGHSAQSAAASRAQGQDGPCCGSQVPAGPKHLTPDTRHLSRQLYCGTFYSEPGNRLANQRPPRVNNLTVVAVDQDNRRVTIRWQEPSMDISGSSSFSGNQARGDSSLAAQQESAEQVASGNEPPYGVTGEQMALTSGNRKPQPNRRHLSSRNEDSNTWQPEAEDQPEIETDTSVMYEQQPRSAVGPRGLIVGGPVRPGAAYEPQLQQNRYEIKLFTDREALKRAFDARQEVGFRFSEWNVEGSFPNASAYGGTKEVTLRVPYGREGVYYVAMKVYNNLGQGSHLSHIGQFWLRNNLTMDELESIYGQAAAGGTVDAEGNVFDRNGELIHRGAGSGAASGQFLRGTQLDGVSVLVVVSIVVFLFSLVCITLVACLAHSARRSLAKQADDKKPAVTTGSQASTMGLRGAGSGSSMVSSSGCESSQQSEVASSTGGSDGGHDVELPGGLSKQQLTATSGPPVAVASEQDAHPYAYSNNLQHQHLSQQQQAQLIKSQMMAATGNGDHRGLTVNYQQQQYNNEAVYSINQHDGITHQSVGPAGKQQQYPQANNNNNNGSSWHTMVNGYAYATVNNNHAMQMPQDNQLEGSLNQNGLGQPGGAMSPVQSWPADILLSHYDKVKQARERNEAPPVMRIETLERQGQFSDLGLPEVSDFQQQILSFANESQQQQQQSPTTSGAATDGQSYLVRQQRSGQLPSYFNLQLQQQLSSVLKSKQQQQRAAPSDQVQVHELPATQNNADNSSPALEGVHVEPPMGMLAEHEQRNYQLEQQLTLAPPPQYIYCASGLTSDDANGSGLQQSTTEPSIYSQVTNLQQVPASNSSDPSLMNSYYANHHLWPQQQHIYSSASSSTSGELQQQQQQTRVKLINGDEFGQDKSNSAISEV